MGVTLDRPKIHSAAAAHHESGSGINNSPTL